MKHGFIKVAAATPRVTVADCKANGEEILKAIHEMEKEHVKLMVFPEFCITGYTCHDLFSRDVFWTVRGMSFCILQRRQGRRTP